MTNIVVTSTEDSGNGSLRAAIAQAGNGDTITFASSLANSTITLGSTLTVTTGVTINGGQNNITISGNNKVTDFTIANANIDGATPTTNIVGLSIKNGNGIGAAGDEAGGNAGGGIYEASGSSLALINDAFSNDRATGGASPNYGGNAAGAVYVDTSATITAS